MNSSVIFHVAFPVKDIQQTKEYYVDLLGCKAGRETAASVILHFYGHQLVAHLTKETLKPQGSIYPRHFGLIFTNEADWEKFEQRLKESKIKFYEEPKRRFIGKITEHRTMFLEDPFHNLLEFKYYVHPEAIFGQLTGESVGDLDAQDI